MDQMTNPTWQKGELEVASHLYYWGMPVRYIGGVIGRSQSAVHEKFKRENLERKSKKYRFWTAEREEYAVQSFLKGYSYTYIARELGTTKGAVAGKLRDLKVYRRDQRRLTLREF